MVDGLPFLHGVFQAHAARNSVAAACVDGLDFFHLFAGQAVVLHGEQGSSPCNHGDDAEQNDNNHVHAGGVRVVLGGQAVKADKADGHADHGSGQAGNQLVNQAEQSAHDTRDILAGDVGLVVRAVGNHGDGHIGSSVISAIANAEQSDEQDGVNVDGNLAVRHQRQGEGIALAPQEQQHQNADVADQRNADIAHQAGFAEFSAQSSEEYDGIPGDPNTPHRTVWPWISVFVDDNDQPCRTFELTNKSTKYLIYSGTDEQEHTVRVVKLTENIKTGLSLHGFDVDGEILMPVVEPIKKRIEFVGDSITCGFGLGTSEKDRFYYPQEENVWVAHGPTAARYLGMDWQMICISGICLAPRKEIPMPVAMNMLYEYTDRPAQQALELDADHWNFKEHPVDYVVINLGTNDATAASFSTAPKKIEEQYEKDYVHFLKTVRKCNGDKTKIICALGSMDYYFYDAMNRAVDTYRAETGDNNVYTFKYCRMSPMDPIGASGHPSELTQQKMAKELVAFINTLEKNRNTKNHS